MNSIQYSVLTYSPSVLTSERINLGVFFYDTNDNRSVFRHTMNWKRVSAFDEEINMDFLRDYLNDIAEELSSSNASKLNWGAFLGRFVNEMKFTKSTLIETDNAAEFIDQTMKIQLRYDYEKSERPTFDEQMKYAKNYLKSINIKYSTKNVFGKFNESIGFDYMINDIGFKHFEFSNKNIKKMFASAHYWRDIARDLNDSIKIYFICDDVLDESNEHYKKILSLMNDSSATVLNMNQAIDRFNDLRSECDKRQIGVNELCS